MDPIWFLVLFFGGTILLFAFASGAERRRLSTLAAQGVTTEGTVVSLRTDSRTMPRRSTDTLHGAEVKGVWYSYTLPDGSEHRGVATLSRHRDILGSLVPGASVTVRYLPERPKVSALEALVQRHRGVG